MQNPFIKDNPTIIEDIKRSISDIDGKVVQYKKDLIEKYNVPYYVGKPMLIDIENRTIYIED